MTDEHRDKPWEHPDWYDLHDTTWTAGPEREPEHYRELVLALPPLGSADHLVDAGAGTGKLAALVARGYPTLGQLTLLEPNAEKLERAATKLRELLPDARVDAVRGGIGDPRGPAIHSANLVIVGSVLMPVMELGGGTLTTGLTWLRAALHDVLGFVRQGGWFYDVETLAAPWASGGPADPVRRLTLTELTEEFTRAGFANVECVYRFRDRVILKARRA